MDKNELEKLFDEFWEDGTYWDWSRCEIDRWIMLKFIFETMMLEVLKNILWKEKNSHWDSYVNWENRRLYDIKQKAKELYNINL